MQDILSLFHHIHHNNGEHIVHHCGGKHAEIDPKLTYNISHCSCDKHKINQKIAIGHDFDMNTIRIEFKEKCPEGGWHLESGKIIS